DDVCRLETERIRECQRISRVAGAERVDVERKRLREPYAVGDLHFHPTGEAGADDLPRHVPGKVRPASIDLRRILPAEGAATVSAHTAVCIDYDLAAGQSGIDRRPALDAAVRWLDDEVDTLVVSIAEDAGHQLFANVLLYLTSVDVPLVLRRDEHRFDGRGHAVPVRDGDLRLAVGAEPRNAASPIGREAFGESMGQVVGQWHELGGLCRRVTEHQSLVP